MSTIVRTTRTPAIPSLLWKALEPATPRIAVLLVADITAMAAATGLGFLFPFGAIGFTSDETLRLVPPPGVGTQALALILVWISIVALAGAYTSRRTPALGAQCARLVVATALLVGTLSLLTLLLQWPMSISALLVTPTLGVFFLLLGRSLATVVLRRMRSHGVGLRRAVSLFPEAAPQDLLARLHRHPEVGVELIGAVPEQAPGIPTADLGPTTATDTTTRIGTPGANRTVNPEPEHIIRTMVSLGADTLVVPAGAPGLDADHLRAIRWELDSHDFQLLVLPPLSGVGDERISLEVGEDLALLKIRPARYRGSRYALKRAFDVAASSVGILLLAPLWLLVAAVVRLGDGGPALFVQQRVGTNGVTFPMFKFRTMVPDAEGVLAHLERTRDAGNDVMFKMRHDPRVTPAGRILRRFSIDELPQLFNVWLGHMSLVGPRPCLPREAALYEDVVHRRFLVRPGITGLWQTSGRSNLSWEETVRLDLYYVENWTMRRDLMILARTARAVASTEGAY